MMSMKCIVEVYKCQIHVVYELTYINFVINCNVYVHKLNQSFLMLRIGNCLILISLNHFKLESLEDTLVYKKHTGYSEAANTVP